MLVAGAFAAGALVFRGGGDDSVIESEVHCVESVEGSDDDYEEVFDDEKRALCSEDTDTMKITIIHESQ